MNIESVAEKLLNPDGRHPVVPGCSHVYVLFLAGEVVYVGMSKQIEYRLSTHISGRTNITFDAYSFETFGTHADAANVERALIRRFMPRFNKVVAMSEYTGTPESNKEKRAMEFAARQEKRRAYMEKQAEKNAAWWAKLPQSEKDRIREQTVSYHLHCNPHLTREQAEQYFDRRNEAGE